MQQIRVPVCRQIVVFGGSIQPGKVRRCLGFVNKHLVYARWKYDEGWATLVGYREDAEVHIVTAIVKCYLRSVPFCATVAQDHVEIVGLLKEVGFGYWSLPKAAR